MQSVAVWSPGVERVAGRVLGRPGPSLLEALRPSAGTRTKIAVSVALIGLTSVLAWVRFYLPDNPVPVTCQTLGVLLMGGVLGWRWALLSVVGYYLLGMAGAPVFQGGHAGWHYAAGSVTGGYLLGFLLSAPAVAFLTQRGWNRSRALWPMLIGSAVIYLPALLWLSVFDFGWPAEGELLSEAVYRFLPGDLLKLAFAALAVGVGWRYADVRRRRRPATPGEARASNARTGVED